MNDMNNLLRRLGYNVDSIDIWDEKVEEIHQGRFAIIVTHRNRGSPNEEKDLYKLVNILPSDIRRRIFVVLVGDEYKTGNGTQAFTSMADLVCHPQDLASADIIFRSTVAERTRFYRSYLEVFDNL